VIDQRGRRGVAIPGGHGVVGVLVFLAFQLLSACSVPPGFDDGTTASDSGEIPASQDPERDLADFSAYVFLEAQEMWQRTFAGRPYQRAKLVLYRSAVSTGCGSASSAVGPFYCPGDGRVTSTAPSTATWSAGSARPATSRGRT
jgi:uncharacterized protein